MRHISLLLALLVASLICYCILGPFHPQSLFDVGFLSQILPKNPYPFPGVCDYAYGNWVWDENYPLRKYTEKCPFLDIGFRCRLNGRLDNGYLKWRWQPFGCDLPRFNAIDFLTRFRNGRVVFAGDSIGRNQWESLVCMLAQGVTNQSTIFEENGKPITKHKGYLSMRFGEYNLTVEHYRVPFLVMKDRPPKDAPKQVQGTIRVDRLHWFSTKWIGANLLVFSAGHWWQPDKTRNSGQYFQEGSTVNMSIDAREGFRRSLNTLKQWASQNIDHENCQIIFRSYSPVHYRCVDVKVEIFAAENLPFRKIREFSVNYSNGTWNTGGNCHTLTAPESGHTKIEPEPWHNQLLSEVIKQMQSAKIKAKFLNITYLTSFRKDGHPSNHREPGTPVAAPEDCSHWCLPGVPDTWNELLYAYSMASK